MLAKLKAFIKKIASHDPSSWASHWLICVFVSILAALIFGWIGGLIVSEILLIYFAMRETSNWITHKRKGHPPGLYQRDGLLDFAGPAVNHLIWWVGFFL